MIHHDTIFTNVAVTADNEPVVGRQTEGGPAIDWQGRPYDKANGPAAHPNSRFTVSAQQNPTYSTTRPRHPEGVPISAIVFGGRRRELAPLVYQAKRLGARRAGRRERRVGDDGGRHRPGRRRAPRLRWR